MTISRVLYAVALSACIGLTGCSGSSAPVAPARDASLAGRDAASSSAPARAGGGFSPFVFGPSIAQAALRTRQLANFSHAAATCTPLTINFPGHGTVSLTAAVVGPVSNATVDASGCDIGIYLDSSASGALVAGDTIVDANQFAVLAIGTQSLGISNLNIARIGNHDPDGTYDPNGVQTGVGLYFEGVGATVNATTIAQYQKNGTAFNGGSNVAVSNTSTTGAGSVDYIAQNGIQYYNSTVGLANRNFAKLNIYSNPADLVYDHQATGFLLLCTNIQYPAQISAFERINFSSQNDYNFYVSNAAGAGC
jgi:hypothetical protein